MVKKWFSILAALLFVAGAGPVGAQLVDLGPPISPHGYPAFYEDSNGLQLDLCLPPPAGTATRPDLCVFDPIDEDTDLIVTGESFWWLAEATMPMPGGGDADLTLAVEATFGGDHDPVNGNQISFARTRIRIDTSVAGTYTVYLPFGDPIVFENVPADSRGINYTSDIGSTNFRDPEAAYRGTLNGGVGPFLTWPDFRENEALQVLELDELGEPTGVVLEQYIGDPNIASVVTDGTEREIIFRVVGPEGSEIDVQTNLFFVMGKEFNTPLDELVAHEFPEVPDTTLFAVGPVNRVSPFAADPGAIDLLLQPAGLVTGVDHAYPVGYPLWYQEALTEIDELAEAPVLVGGLQLTLCPPFDPMCIGDPIDLTDDAMFELRSGGEQFWYLATSEVRIGDNRFLLTLAVEATFGGDHAIVDGNQIAFGRERLRIDTPVAGTYRVTHPYGQRVFENLPAGRRAINFTSDIGITDPADPDSAMVGTLFSAIGPRYLTWPEYETVDSLKRFLDPSSPETSPVIQYIGNPAVLSPVVGSPFDTNYFQVERLVSGDVENGQWETVAFTDDFSVMGKVFDQETFAAYDFEQPLQGPAVVSLAGSLDMAVQQSIAFNVLAGATFEAPATINIVSQPVDGTAVKDDAAGTITYTPSAAFAAEGGTDILTYNIVDATGLTSNQATITVTVVPVVPDEAITIGKARLALNKLRWDLSGDSNRPGSTLTVYAGPTISGTPIGTAVVSNNGKWRLRATTTTNPNVTSISISSSAGGQLLNQPLDVR